MATVVRPVLNTIKDYPAQTVATLFASLVPGPYFVNVIAASLYSGITIGGQRALSEKKAQRPIRNPNEGLMAHMEENVQQPVQVDILKREANKKIEEISIGYALITVSSLFIGNPRASAAMHIVVALVSAAFVDISANISYQRSRFN
jgi:hypothetical protein